MKLIFDGVVEFVAEIRSESPPPFAGWRQGTLPFAPSPVRGRWHRHRRDSPSFIVGTSIGGVYRVVFCFVR